MNYQSLSVVALAATLFAVPALAQQTMPRNSLSPNPEKVEVLDLNGRDLESIPEDLVDFRALQELDLSNNDLQSTTGPWASLSQLTTLNLNHNPALDHRQLFEGAQRLGGLRSLSMQGCGMPYLVSELGDFGQLRHLDLSNNNLYHLPSTVGQLSRLEHLDLAGNDLEVLHFALTHCQRLQSIDVSYNPKLDLENTCFKLAYLPGLTKVSMNGAEALPRSIELLEGLEELEARDGSFDVLPVQLKKLKHLKRVALTDCPNLKTDKTIKQLADLDSLTSLELVQGTMTELPRGISKMENLQELTLGGKELTSLGSELAALPALRSMTIQESPALAWEEALNGFQQIAKLEKAGVHQWTNGRIGEGLAQLRSLKALDLSDNGITTLPADLGQMKWLKKLDLRGNDLSGEEISALQKQLPHCQISFSESRPVEYAVVDEPIEDVNVPQRYYRITPEEPAVLKYESGTTLDVPANAFLNAKGEVVTGPVDITYREFNDPLEIMLSGIPMTIEQDGETRQFESAGMVELNASQNGEPLFPNPDNPIMINMISTTNSDKYNLYYLNPESGAWQERGKDEIRSDPETEAALEELAALPPEEQAESDLMASIAEDPPYLPQPPRMQSLSSLKEHLFTDVRRSSYTREGRKKNVFSLYGKRRWWFFFRKRKERGRFYFKDARTLAQYYWVCDGENPKEDYALLDSLERVENRYERLRRRVRRFQRRFGGSFREYEIAYGPTALHEIWVEPNPGDDNFLVSMVVMGDTHTVAAYPAMKGQSIDQQQRFTQRMFGRYAGQMEKRQEVWAEREAENNRLRDEYEAEMEKYRVGLLANLEKRAEWTDKSSRQIARSDRGTLTGRVIRSFPSIASFGIFNVDHVREPLAIKTQNVFASYEQSNGTTIEPKTVYVLDNTYNTVERYGEGGEKKVDDAIQRIEFAEMGLVVITEDDQIGVVDYDRFNREVNKARMAKVGKERKRVRFTLELSPADDLDLAAIRNEVGN